MNEHDVCSKLKFISRLEVGDKVNVKYMLVQKDGLLTRLSRMFYDENRGNTLNFVKNTITRTFEILKAYETSENMADRLMCTNLLQDLDKAKAGIRNLKETYDKDIKFTCDMDTLLQSITARLSNHSDHDGTRYLVGQNEVQKSPSSSPRKEKEL